MGTPVHAPGRLVEHRNLCAVKFQRHPGGTAFASRLSHSIKQIRAIDQSASIISSNDGSAK